MLPEHLPTHLLSFSVWGDSSNYNLQAEKGDGVKYYASRRCSLLLTYVLTITLLAILFSSDLYCMKHEFKRI